MANTRSNPSTAAEIGYAPTAAPWHTRSVNDVASTLGVDPSVGLRAVEVAARQHEYGPNQLR